MSLGNLCCLCYEKQFLFLPFLETENGKPTGSTAFLGFGPLLGPAKASEAREA